MTLLSQLRQSPQRKEVSQFRPLLLPTPILAPEFPLILVLVVTCFLNLLKLVQFLEDAVAEFALQNLIASIW